jgi:mRNA-degrading endonuclease RelE of RelBE toxin-antitoxin system
MKMNVIFHRGFQKFVAKLKNKKLVTLIKEEVDKIIEDPSSGKLLEQPFRKYLVKSVRFSHDKNSYRIAYTLNEDELVFLLIDSRENFYKKLERMM